MINDKRDKQDLRIGCKTEPSKNVSFQTNAYFISPHAEMATL